MAADTPKADMPGAKPGARTPKLRYQDRPELSETFADSIRSCVFDGQVMRIEFTVSRFDDPGALGILEGRQVPVSRMVLSRGAMNDLFNRMNQLSAALKQANAAATAAKPDEKKN